MAYMLIKKFSVEKYIGVWQQFTTIGSPEKVVIK
jgi:hypothetical protein